MAHPNQILCLPFGKRNWAISELKEILDIQLLHLRCHAPIQPYAQGGQECFNSISIWYSMKVRGLLQQLSKSNSTFPDFAILLHQLAKILCCKSLHGESNNWENKVCENWKTDLYTAAAEEVRYLQERKALQDALRIRRPRIRSHIAADDAGLESEAEVVVPMPLPKSRSVMTLKRDPSLVRIGPKPIIHCIRHAEAGNGQEKDFYTRDPELNEKGIRECANLSRIFNRHDSVTHLIVSPLSRCISTALNAFAPTIQNGVKVTLVPEIQAASSCWSCIGLPPKELKEKYSVEEYGDIFDFDWVGESWTNKLDGIYACDERSVYKRVKDIFRWCRDGVDADNGENGEREIVLITHASILVHFGHDWDVNTAAWTTFTFDENWKIYETPESKRRRHAPNPLPEPYSQSESGSSSSAGTIKASRIPVAPFSNVKFRPNMTRDAEGASNYSNEAYRPRMASEIMDDTIFPDEAIISNENEHWF